MNPFLLCVNHVTYLKSFVTASPKKTFNFVKSFGIEILNHFRISTYSSFLNSDFIKSFLTTLTKVTFENGKI